MFAPPKQKIFISYRRDDSGLFVGRLFDSLSREFGEHRVFLDKESLRTGDKWRPQLEDEIKSTFVMIVVIGPRWLWKRPDGTLRLSDADDVVRKEIESALTDSDCRIIPLLYSGAEMPDRSSLPESLAGLADPQGERSRTECKQRIDDDQFRDDVARLARAISRIDEERKKKLYPSVRPVVAPRRWNRWKRWIWSTLRHHTIHPNLTRRLMRDEFVRQDPEADIKDYGGEKPLAGYLPYVEVKSWVDDLRDGKEPKISVKILEGFFKVASWGEGHGDLLRENALEFAKKRHPKTFDGGAVRISEAHSAGHSLFLTAQRTSYFQQRKSNLCLDYLAEDPGVPRISLRDMLRLQYGQKLPPLDDPRLANSLGVACLIVIRKQGHFLPYLVARTNDVAIYNFGGEWHCTASGVALIDEKQLHRKEFFYLDSMLMELHEETGLLEGDLDYFAPVAFCREMARGGKPQMFFIGITSVSRAKAEAKLRHARRLAGDSGLVVENVGNIYTWSPRDLRRESKKKGLTIEAAACLHYYDRLRAEAPHIFV